MTSDPTERFWAKVAKGSGCWEWQAAIKANGYGSFGLRAGKMVYAHRFAWELENGPIPDGQCVLHRCDNRRCVRPEHLFLGTFADNNRDTHQKGRAVHPRGEAAGAAKLTARQAQEIRVLYTLHDHTLRSLAKRYGLDSSCVSRIVSGHAY